MFVSVLGAVVNIILNLVFIKKYVFIAAGYTTVFTYLVFCFAHYILYKYIAKKEKTGNVYNDSILMILGIAVLVISEIFSQTNTKFLRLILFSCLNNFAPSNKMVFKRYNRYNF